MHEDDDTPEVSPLADLSADFSTELVLSDRGDADAGTLVTDHWRR